MNPLPFQNSSSYFNSSDTQDYFRLSRDEKTISSVLYGIFGSIGALENMLVFVTFYTCMWYSTGCAIKLVRPELSFSRWDR